MSTSALAAIEPSSYIYSTLSAAVWLLKGLVDELHGVRCPLADISNPLCPHSQLFARSSLAVAAAAGAASMATTRPVYADAGGSSSSGSSSSVKTKVSTSSSSL